MNVTRDRLLADPLIQSVMKADRVDASEILTLYQTLCATGAPHTGGRTPKLLTDMAILPAEDPNYRSGVGSCCSPGTTRLLLGSDSEMPGNAPGNATGRDRRGGDTARGGAWQAANLLSEDRPSIVLADAVYDADHFGATIANTGTVAIIPTIHREPRSTRSDVNSTRSVT